jgi:signal transduction histidine kinase
MSIRTKILSAFLALAMVSVLAGGVSLVLLQRGRLSLEAEADRIDRYSDRLQRSFLLVDSIYNEIISSLLVAEGRGPDSQARLDGNSVEFYRQLEEMTRLFPQREVQHRDFREAFISYYVFANRLLEQNDFQNLSGNPQLLNLFHERQTHLSVELGEALAWLRSANRTNLEKMEQTAESMSRLSLGVAAATILTAALAAWLLSRSFARPMTRLVRWVESTEGAEYEGDDASAKAKAGSGEFWGTDEVGRLARAFVDLRQRLAVKERELMKRNLESVGRLAGGVAHEFNNILGAISACLHPLKTGSVSPAQLREEVERMSLLCRRGGELSTQLLAVAGKSTRHSENVNPSYFAKQLENLLPRLVPERIELRVRAEDDLPEIQCSTTLLLSAILNLVYNAADVMPEGGCIALAVGRETDSEGRESVVFTVRDTGSGIPPEMIPLIFDPFYTTKGPGKGAGLGLSIVHSFAEHHDGSVSVTSGKGGTAFVLRLPVSRSGPVPGAPGPRRVAILTDRRAAGDLVAQALEAAGMSPLLPASGENLLDALQKFSPPLSLALIDTEMKSIAPDLIYKLMKHFFPGASIAFFGSDRHLAEQIDPESPWIESPDTDSIRSAEALLCVQEDNSGQYRTH